MTDEIEQLTAQLAQAKQAEAERVRAEQAAALERERNYRKQWLANYDRTQLDREVTATRRALHDASTVAEALEALVGYQAATWRRYRAAALATNHRGWLANDAGEDPPRDEADTSPSALVGNDVAELLNRMVTRRLEEWSQLQDQQYADAVYGQGLTEDEIRQAEQEAEQRRREEAAKSISAPSIDTSGWTDAQRMAAGLEPARSRPLPNRLG